MFSLGLKEDSWTYTSLQTGPLRVGSQVKKRGESEVRWRNVELRQLRRCKVKMCLFHWRGKISLKKMNIARSHLAAAHRPGPHSCKSWTKTRRKWDVLSVLHGPLRLNLSKTGTVALLKHVATFGISFTRSCSPFSWAGAFMPQIEYHKRSRGGDVTT